MNLIKMHRFDDGSPIEFDSDRVALIEPNRSGAGTTVWLAIGDRAHELHLQEPFEGVRTEMHLGPTERAVRNFLDRRGEKPSGLENFIDGGKENA